MRRLVWILAFVASCEKDKPASDPALDQFMADFLEYGERVVPMLAKFDGDCSAMADRLLTLEPLTKKIRAEGTALDQTKIKQRAAESRDKIMQRYAELAKSLGMTTADIDKKEAEMKSKCASDPKWLDAQERTGLMKKKKPTSE